MIVHMHTNQCSYVVSEPYFMAIEVHSLLVVAHIKPKVVKPSTSSHTADIYPIVVVDPSTKHLRSEIGLTFTVRI